MSKLDNVVTRSELSSGKSSVKNMVLTPLETLTFNWKESTFTITKLLEKDMYSELS